MFGTHGPWKHWMRHTASVPKGFLRYHVLGLLKEKPMSGSEIMEEVAKETDERWKPSPGSIYPLLAWLQDNGYIKETPAQESGIKRYALTEQGEKFLEEQTKMHEEIRKRFEFMAPPFFGGFSGFRPLIHPENIREVRESFTRLAKAFMELVQVSGEKLPTQTLKEIAGVLDSTASRLEEISKKLREEGKK